MTNPRILGSTAGLLAVTQILVGAGPENTTTGTPWQLPVDDFVRSGVVLGPEHQLYFGDMKGNCYAADPQSQNLKWSTRVNGPVSVSPVVSPTGELIVATETGSLHALAPHDGTEHWSYELGGSIQTSPLSLLDGRLFVGDSEGTLYSLDSDTGHLRWTYQARRGNYGAITGGPVMDRHGRLYFIMSGGNTATLTALETESRKLLWTISMPGDGWAGPIVNNQGDLVFGTDARQIHCITEAGRLRWSFSADGTIKGAPVVDREDNVYFGTLANTAYSLNASGQLRWAVPLKGDIRGAMAVTASGAVLVADQGRVHRITAQGNAALVYDTHSTHLIRSPLLLTREGWLYFGSDDKRLHAVSMPEGLDFHSHWPSGRADLRGSGQVFPSDSDAIVLGYGPRLPHPGVVVASRIGTVLHVRASTDLKSWQPFAEASSANGVRYLPDSDSEVLKHRFFQFAQPSGR